jgi:hypothetical protein
LTARAAPPYLREVQHQNEVRPPSDDDAPDRSVLAEAVTYLRAHKWLWIAPLIILVVLILALLTLDDSPIAPFIYRHY